MYALINQNSNLNNNTTDTQSKMVTSVPVEDQNVTSKDLQVEQMKLQRQVMQTQRMRQRMESEERLNRARQLSQMQRNQQKEDQSDRENQVKVKKLQEDSINPADRNWNLVKSKAKTTPPISMKQ